MKLLALVCLAAMATPAGAQTRPPDLGQLSIEDLMDIKVTSVSRKEQRTMDVAAAVFVITRDDIRRSGMTTIPDLLRLAPGVNVAQINANKWAVTVRGFNGLYAAKLLVLVDGRSVYNRLFSGILWDGEDLMLDDIERIEVIRGPGAAIWGANAMNGVINIITRPAADTQGVLVRANASRADEQAAVRYGGTFGSTSYRAYSQWTERNPSVLVPGTNADDQSHTFTAGLRMDTTWGRDAFTLETDGTAGQSRALWLNLDPQTAATQPLANDPADSLGGHLMGRWTRTRANGASLLVQSYLDFLSRLEPVADYHRGNFGADAQYHTALGARQDLVAGAGYRFFHERLDGHTGASLTPPESDASLSTAFVQDDIALVGDRLTLTLSSQVQYDSDAGFGVQPSVRAMWKGLPRQRIWGAVSRALRTPSLTDRGIRLDYPPETTPSGLPLFVTFLGSTAVRTETLVDAEAGYRLAIGAAGSIDVTGFTGRYANLLTHENDDPVLQFTPFPSLLVTSRVGNELTATTNGLEVAGHWAPSPSWRLDGSYTLFHIDPRLSATSRALDAGSYALSAPSGQWDLSSAYSPGTHLTLTGALFHVGPLEHFAVNAYTRADAGVDWQFNTRLSVRVLGQNLLDPSHAEFTGTEALLLATQVPRSVGVRFMWAY